MPNRSMSLSKAHPIFPDGNQHPHFSRGPNPPLHGINTDLDLTTTNVGSRSATKAIKQAKVINAVFSAAKIGTLVPIAENYDSSTVQKTTASPSQAHYEGLAGKGIKWR